MARVQSNPISVQRPPPASKSNAVKPYLLAYNFASFAAWSYFLYTIVHALISSNCDFVHVFAHTHRLLLVIQTAAIFDIIHAFLGLVPSQVLSNIIQVGSRTFVVWFACAHALVGGNWIYSMMAIAWSISDAIRYLYYILNLAGIKSEVVTWLRYSLFLVLYPVGTVGEFMLINSARSLNEFQKFHVYPHVEIAQKEPRLPGSS
jgi:very-long-chain (3R)-3-hydroxyacyl-CoA dehydratase